MFDVKASKGVLRGLISTQGCVQISIHGDRQFCTGAAGRCFWKRHLFLDSSVLSFHNFRVVGNPQYSDILLKISYQKLL